MASRTSRPRVHGLVASNVVSSVTSSVARGLAPGLALIWYVAVVLPEAQTVLHRQVNRKDVPWTSPTRSLTCLAALCYCASLPGAALLRLLKHRQAAALVSTGVVVNPPTVLVASVMFVEICSLARRLITIPVRLFKR